MPHNSSTGLSSTRYSTSPQSTLSPAAGQLGVRPAGVVDRGERRAVRPRPVGQGPVLGDRGRQLALLHRRGARRRRLRGRGRLLATGQHDDRAGGGYGNQDGRARQHAAFPPHPWPPAASPKRERHFCVAALRMVMPPGLFDGWDASRVDEGLTIGGVRKVLHAVLAHALGEPEGCRLLLRASLCHSRRPVAPEPCTRRRPSSTLRGSRRSQDEVALRVRVREVGDAVVPACTRRTSPPCPDRWRSWYRRCRCCWRCRSRKVRSNSPR